MTLRYYAPQLKFMMFLLSLSLRGEIPSSRVPLFLATSLSPYLFSPSPTPLNPFPPPLSISHSCFSNLVEKPCMYLYLVFQQSIRNSSALGRAELYPDPRSPLAGAVDIEMALVMRAGFKSLKEHTNNAARPEPPLPPSSC